MFPFASTAIPSAALVLVVGAFTFPAVQAGARAFLHGHRTATHSIVGTVVLIAAVAGGFWIAGKKFPKLAVNILPALLICTIGAGIHLFLDLLNGYGVKLMWPFSAKWYAWDIADSVDAWIIFFLLAGLLSPPRCPARAPLCSFPPAAWSLARSRPATLSCLARGQCR